MTDDQAPGFAKQREPPFDLGRSQPLRGNRLVKTSVWIEVVKSH
jgi:hypothetical protein